jgi:hypothetical protein
VTVDRPVARKPGRPRKYAEGRQHATVRFTPQRYAELQARAAITGRSLSEEVEHRVEQTFFEAPLRRIEDKFEAIAKEIEKAQIYLLTAEQHSNDALRARLAEAEKQKLDLEGMVERAVERAMARLFSKMIGGNE